MPDARLLWLAPALYLPFTLLNVTFPPLISRLPQEQTLSQLQPRCLSVWLVVHWVNGPGLITEGHFSHERFISCFQGDRKEGPSVPLAMAVKKL